MGEVKTQSTIWKFVGGVSTITGLVCFALSSSYDMSFGKLGIWGLLVYLLISSIMLCLIYFVKKIEVPERFQGVVATILFVAIFFISVKLNDLLPGKSDALSIISYGLFALTSLCTSRESELGFETGFFSFFLSLFLQQLFKTNLKLLPIALVFCLATILLYHHSQSASPNGDRPQEVAPSNAVAPPNAVAPSNAVAIDISDEESQYSREKSPLRTSNQENNQEESCEAAHHPPSHNGGVSEESILEETRSSFPATRYSPSKCGQVSEENISDNGDSGQNNEQEEGPSSSFTYEDQVSSENNMLMNRNGGMRSSVEPELVSAEALGLRRRPINKPEEDSTSSSLALRKKIVLKVELQNDKIMKKAMTAVSVMPGVESVEVDMKENKMTVIGGIDAVTVAGKLRTVSHAEIVLVGPKEEAKKPDPPKPEEPEPELELGIRADPARQGLG